MELNFCYIEGLSRENTIKFPSLEKQSEYFDSVPGSKVISNSFYPPYYRNRIKVASSDLTLLSQYNYLWFEYQSKRYYYFISNVSYVSEDVLELSIYMDTIQTYMFDFKVHSGIVRRKFIDRTDSLGNINRNYIRENVSLNQHELIKRKEYKFAQDFSLSVASNDGIEGYYIVVTTTSKDVVYTGIYEQNGNISPSPYVYWIVPKFHVNEVVNIESEDGKQKALFETSSRLSQLASQPNCVKVSYIPGNPFVQSIYSEGNTIKVSQAGGFTLFTFNELACWIVADNPAEYNLTDLIELDINTEFGGQFDSKKVPALLDENYMNVFFGDNRANSTFPIHLLTHNRLYLRYYVDYDGNCYYGVLENYSEPFTYNTICVAQASLSPVVTDSYKQYQEYNKWSLVGAIASTSIGIGASVLTANPIILGGAVAGVSGIVTAAANMGSSNSTNFSNIIPAYGGADLKATRHYSDITGITTYLPYKYGTSERGPGVMDYNTDSEKFIPPTSLAGVGQAARSLNYLTGAVTAMANAHSAPNIPKGTGSEMTDTASGANLIRLEISRVHDFETCAQYYHRYGYLVNEYIQPTSQLFSDLDTRKYYNYVEFADLDVELSLLTFDACASDLKSRLMEGVRLWNVTETGGTIGDYRLDNIERSKLNGQ